MWVMLSHRRWYQVPVKVPVLKVPTMPMKAWVLGLLADVCIERTSFLSGEGIGYS